jgi:small ligand-binding sensory domain FIST
MVMNEQQVDFKRGDFLIRNIVGFDPEKGCLMIGSALKVGQTIQFQLRDAETSGEDLKALLGKLRSDHPSESCGALLVSCCGRGQGLYGRPDHDAKMVQRLIGPMPMTGFFANGEIGPIGGKNYIHGYTSSLVIFR